jgi:hypothetical protein
MCSSQNIIRMIASRRMSWAEHVARVESMERVRIFFCWGLVGEERERGGRERERERPGVKRALGRRRSRWVYNSK